MLVQLQRLFVKDQRATIGALTFPGDMLGPACFTLEDRPRTVKVPGETCIPPGSYRLALRKVGRVYATYSARHHWNQGGMLELEAVPGFEAVLIHAGNKPEDTAGCILVGETAHMSRGGEGESYIASSLNAYRKVYMRILEAMGRGDVWLEVLNAEGMPRPS